MSMMQCYCIGCLGRVAKFILTPGGWRGFCEGHLIVHCPECFRTYGLTEIWPWRKVRSREDRPDYKCFYCEKKFSYAEVRVHSPRLPRGAIGYSDSGAPIWDMSEEYGKWRADEDLRELRGRTGADAATVDAERGENAEMAKAAKKV